ncbi:PEFG-CTERM sorting domain-containing protein [Candidatus Nitrosotenuis sp. DW1]|uniref:PEFG-CTERM sorting domain-containing protein n=1 Tax=Candidatus Nitrosotenuis sp. DW1 TaxID=2259672 RepID=UPI0021037B7A|nr:PEFG-CTERM sorting domain-containing protein [Candidatus Nitrosotenuis sp. DW1]
MKSLLAIFALIVIASSVSTAFADADYDEKLAFAGSLEETLGHFWAIEQNLDDNNAELALVHATHPIAELYDIMKPVLQKSSPDLDSQVNQILVDLGKKTGKDVTRQDAQDAIDEAREVVEIARTAIVGDELSQDTNFKMKLMQGLLETSKGEYEEAITDGEISMMAEFQDGSAFVWRSQQIFDEIKSELPEHEAEEIEEFYGDLWAGYDSRANPEEITTMANGVIHELDEIMGVESEDADLLDYVENIRSLLKETKEEYAAGNTDEALSLATKAYLDNFEFLESPIAQQNPELKEDIEHMMREELRDMIKAGAPASEVDTQVDAILVKMNDVAKIVPEFPFGALIAMTSILGVVIAITKIKGSKLIKK